jgi:ribosomal protein S18 acetylase RimI-like enzyme
MAPLSFRPVTPTDEAFLATLYASSRMQELALVDWNEAQKTSFLNMQFAAQQKHYQAHYTDVDYSIVLWDGQACGRLYLARWPGELRVVELTVLSAYQNLGIGTQILKGVLAQAALAGKPVRIHVEQSNPAQGLYRRLGFVAVETHGVHVLMEWRAERAGGD